MNKIQVQIQISKVIIYRFDISMINPLSKRLLSLSNQLIFSNSNSASSQSNIDFVQGKGLPKVILNKPKALNSLNLQMVRDLANLIPKIEKYPAFWVEGAGGKAFCAGGDVKVLYQGDATVDTRQQFFREQFTLDYRIATCKSIEIANWDGIVMGGGVGISHFAPFRIATQNTMFAMPQAKIGFFTDVGSGSTLANLRNNIGMYIALTSGRLKGQQVYNSGFANYFVNRQNIPKIYEQISESITKSNNPKSTIEEVLKKYHKGNPDKKIQNQDQISHIFAGNTVKQIYERAKSSKTAFGQNVVKSLDGVCPLAVHAIHKLIKQSKNLDKKQIFKRDFIVSQNFIVNKDFESGVTSLLITKDNNPKWTHKNLSQVNQEEVDALFKQAPNRKPLQI